MQKLEESELFFRQYGLSLFQEKFPEILPRLAFGLAGRGSEGFGFDDEISQDHDCMRRFFIWIDEKDEPVWGLPLQKAYLALLREHPAEQGKDSMLGEMEHGVMTIRRFYELRSGLPGIPESWQQWLYTPEYAFAEAVNGKVFEDHYGEFSRIRQGIRQEMPQDVRLKKLAARLLEMAQSGQYNYLRCYAHKEYGAAGIMLADFVKSCIQTVFLLNAEFCPYSKWMFRAMKNLPLLAELTGPLEFLLNDPAPHNEKADMIEDICTQIVRELANRNLSGAKGNYLEHHAFEVMKKIRDPHIRSLHVLEG